MGKLTGRKAVVTGGTRGLGLEIAEHFVKEGADVLICGRKEPETKVAERRLADLCTSDQVISSIVADVSKGKDVTDIFSAAMQRLGGCQVLVNNAGIYGPKGSVENCDWEEWIRTYDINVHGSVQMCRAFVPHFKEKSYGKIIQLSGGGATNPLPNLSAYASTKAAIVRFAETLAEEVRDHGIDVNSVAPGALNTKMLEEIIEAGPEKVGQHFFDKAIKQQETGGVPLNVGAELAVFLASSESDGITAKLISAVWDDWQKWNKNKDALIASDAYTIRRISGRDRGFEWGDK
jgi:3-oxoacyl-[acyl-carrier protein] reductase